MARVHRADHAGHRGGVRHHGPYGEWRAPARLYMNVGRAYREFRAEPADAPWNQLATFDALYRVAKARGGHVEF